MTKFRPAIPVAVAAVSAAVFISLVANAQGGLSGQAALADLVEACQSEIQAFASTPGLNGQPVAPDKIRASIETLSSFAMSRQEVEDAEQYIAEDESYFRSNPPATAAQRGTYVTTAVKLCMLKRRVVQLKEEAARQAELQLQGQQGVAAQRAQEAKPAPQQQLLARAEREKLSMPAPSPKEAATDSGQSFGSGTEKAALERQPASSQPEKFVIANNCISLITDPQAYGGFNNSCAFPVYVTWCAHHPKEGAWSSSFDCDKHRGGVSSIQANAWTADHTHNAEYIFWFACKQPGMPKVRYTSGVGFYGTCR